MKTLFTLILTILLATISVNGFAADSDTIRAEAPAYFDTATGHKYIKSADGTYNEYTRKGKLFKTGVSASQPHLIIGRTITQVSEGAYVVYKKYENNKPVRQILPFSVNHPEAWQSEDVLISGKQLAGLSASSR